MSQSQPFWQPLPIDCIANWEYHTGNGGHYEYQALAHETISPSGVLHLLFQSWHADVAVYLL